MQLWIAMLGFVVGRGVVKKKKHKQPRAGTDIPAPKRSRNKISNTKRSGDSQHPSTVDADGERREGFSPVCYLSEFEDW